MDNHKDIVVASSRGRGLEELLRELLEKEGHADAENLVMSWLSGYLVIWRASKLEHII